MKGGLFTCLAGITSLEDLETTGAFGSYLSLSSFAAAVAVVTTAMIVATNFAQQNKAPGQLPRRLIHCISKSRSALM